MTERKYTVFASEEKIPILKSRLERLVAAELELEMLEAHGVDNWIGYSYDRKEYFKDICKDIGVEPTEEFLDNLDFRELAKLVIEKGDY